MYSRLWECCSILQLVAPVLLFPILCHIHSASSSAFNLHNDHVEADNQATSIKY